MKNGEKKSKMPKVPLTIVVPARNEEGNILSTLEEIKKKVKVPHEIIVVDDSSDNTEKLVRTYAKIHKNVKLVHGKPNTISFSKAIKIGTRTASSELIVIVMADLCDDPRTINFMYKRMAQGWDIVCGSRYATGGSKKGGPLIQSFFSKAVCLSLYYFTRISTKDVSNAFKMYKKDTLKKVVIDQRSGVEISMIITLQAHFKGAKITEVPTKWVGRTLGQSKFKILQRTPKYSSIYLWAIRNTARKLLHLRPIGYSMRY